MKVNRILLLCVMVLIASTTYGQKIKVVEGKVNDLEGLTTLNIEYDYSDLSVGKFDVEDDYIAKKVTDMNEDEAGKGDNWKEAWFDDRPTRYEPKFEELFTKYAPSITSGPDIESDVTMLVHTTFIEPGFNVGVARKPASIDLEISFIKGGDELVKILMLKSPGSGGAGYDFDAGFRISEAYAKAAKALGKYLTKELN